MTVGPMVDGRCARGNGHQAGPRLEDFDDGVEVHAEVRSCPVRWRGEEEHGGPSAEHRVSEVSIQGDNGQWRIPGKGNLAHLAVSELAQAQHPGPLYHEAATLQEENDRLGDVLVREKG
ncbi:MAG: hypothetical protein JWM18_4085 [Chloroflexi bacterium]|jgi:hypothetical protein|nr:hypothetical protein [Chloroflexota bacterium]